MLLSKVTYAKTELLMEWPDTFTEPAENYTEVVERMCGKCVSFRREILHAAISVMVAPTSPPIQTPPQRSRDTFQHKGSHKYHPLPLVTVVDAVWRPAFLVFWVEPQPRWRHAIKLIGVWEGEGGSWQINRLTCITLVVGPMKIIIELQWRNFTRNSATIFVVFVSQIMRKECLGSMVIGR